jgi:hypothetical protein
VLEIYKKTAPNSKDIDFQGFRMCLDRFASSYFTKSDQYDTEEKKREAFFLHLGLDDPIGCRKKMQGVRVAFNSHEKEDFRVVPEPGKYSFKIKPHAGKTADEIKEDIRSTRQRHIINLPRENRVSYEGEDGAFTGEDSGATVQEELP